ncbi:MAG: Glycerophosphoryl diester phosphodiesterase [Verrucomicrobiota bacterium]|jgi:glycerophosphoryl diester phosphodiesterase
MRLSCVSLFIAVPLLLMTGCATSRRVEDSQASAQLPAIELLRKDRPLVIGHRGASKEAPENTLAAFRSAMTAGVDLVELDYHHSRDGIPVVIHDATLDRTTDATNRWGGQNLRVSDRTLAELRELSAGRWFTPPFPGESLPTLDEALEVIQAGNVTLIERKDGEAATCVALVRRRSLVNRVVVQSFDWDYLRNYHQLEPDQVLGALGPPGSRGGRKLTDEEKALNDAWLDEISELGAQVAVWNRQVDAASVRSAHARGLKVWVYTIDDPELARNLVDAGVDGVITNDPERLRESITSPALRSR